MGKEQDLLQAAKTGNVAHIEKILGHKTRKSGIQSLMSKTVNPNHQDELGYTPLHHAALSGHRSSAELLLKYDASTNIPDNSGNYPLHLAAWNGHADVARVLINTGPSRANVNEQNGTEDTALHSASQFGQSLVVAVLLENHADPYIRNSRQESPLDLAAQYGRMETVKQLLNYHPNLLEDVNVVRTHTPLHLAARNGHMNVVSYFLSCGMDVNITCTSGTALHEAALFGKLDVVNLLLQCGIDVTVVDSNNKTVIDLLAAHPSAKTREIEGLIYACSLKEPVSRLKRQHTEFRPNTRTSRTSNTFSGFSDRPKSAMYTRNRSYDSVPNHQVFDSDLLRRSGTYDSVPVLRARPESLKQSSYDTVPPPKASSDRHSLDWTRYDEVGSYAGKGYALLGPPEETSPMLSANEVRAGYTFLGSPAQPGTVNNARCPVRPDSTYAEVRNEGENFGVAKMSVPRQTAFDDHSHPGFPSSGEQSEPMPISGMVSEDNPGYFLVGDPNQQLSRSQRQNNESYDWVGSPQGARLSSSRQPSIYEVPSLSLRGKGNGQEGEDTPNRLSSRTTRGQSLDLYENTTIGTKQQSNQSPHRDSAYELVTLPPRKATLDQPSYDVVPAPSRVPQEQRSTAEFHTSSASGARAQGETPCPLDIEGYEFVNLRKPGSLPNDPAPEMQAFAPLPGYEPMAPPEDTGYEILAPLAELQEQIADRGDYETLAMVNPQRTGSQTGSAQITQQPSGRMNAPVSASLYEVPPIMSSSGSAQMTQQPSGSMNRPVSAPLYSLVGALSTGSQTGSAQMTPQPAGSVSTPVSPPLYSLVGPQGTGSHTSSAQMTQQRSGSMKIPVSAPTYSMVGEQTSGSQTGSAQMTEHPSGSMNIPTSAPLYSMAGPQRTGSQTGSAQITQQPSGRMNAPVSASLYEVPPIMSSSVYEIAPPPRDVPPLPPRAAAAVPPQSQSNGEVHWIEKEHESAIPKVPPRRQNEYSEWHPGMRQEPTSPGRPPKPGAYEQVRLEGRSEMGTIDWERVRQMSARGSGGEYCTLSATAVGPSEAKPRESTTSSEISFMSESVLTPPFSPPSPNTAQASVFEAFGALQPSDMSTIPEDPENVEDETSLPPRPMPRKKSKPKALPRSDSLHDEEYAPKRGDAKKGESGSGSFEKNQDPFSFPPAAVLSPKSESSTKSDFVELHKRFSPYSSREDIFTETDSAPDSERQVPDGAETESDVKPSPLIYENVLFKQGDESTDADGSKPHENGNVVKRGASAERPGSYRLSTLSADSPMDEREEWEKIEAFLSSIGQIEVPQTLEQQIANAGKADTLPGWLKALDLDQYESSMMANGFDDINFLNGVLEDEDLLDIGIVDFSHRRTIMEALKSLPVCPRLSDPALTKPEGLEGWLDLLFLPEYFDVFQHNGFTSMERIHMLWEVELTSVLEVNSLGHRKRILASLKEDVKELESKDQSETPNLDESSADLEEKLAELKMYCPDEKPPAAATVSAVSNAGDSMAAAKGSTTSNKQVPTKKPRKSKKWKHESSVLIKGCVNYTTLYLGSHAVKTITGLESTIDACRKMRLSTAKLQKIPSVTLSVSVKGIKFIDARSKIMVSYHDMRNISYITQDPEDRKVFAYIAKDGKTEKHYCHVFRVETTVLSDEVTMTIGQAFELAFGQFVQARKSTC